MDRVKKALDVLDATDNPRIRAEMIAVLRKEFIGLQNSLDASSNHNEELLARLRVVDNAVKRITQSVDELIG